MPTTTSLFEIGRCQAVRLPQELRLPGKKVSIRRLGDGVYIEPITATEWPEGYFESIGVGDLAFARPDQEETPPSPAID